VINISNIDIQNFINNLIIYDYILFGVAFVLFILFILLGILLRNKIGLALFFILIGFSTLILAPTVGYIELHKYLFKNTTTVTSQKRLTFTQAVVIDGKITNNSMFDFSECKITASAYKVGQNKYKNYLLKFKPFQNISMLESNISKGKTRSFKMIMEPFVYSKDYNISIKSKCKGIVK